MKYALLVAVLFFFASSWGQTIFHPKSSKSIVEVKPGKTYHYYDAGGPNGDCGRETNSLITIYPAKEGDFVTINCSSLELSSDTRMYIFDGNHAGAGILGYFNGRSGIAGRTFKASSENPSGAISIRFTSIGIYMSKPGWDFTVTTSSSPGSPPSISTQDCSGAIKVCSDSAITTQSRGKGVQELPGPGFWNKTLNYGGDGENQSNWYKFEVQTAGTIEFLITPNSHTDFDWALWGPYPSHSCPAWTTDNFYRASACDAQYNEGLTGLSSTAGDFVESSGGDCYVAALNVRAGEHYVIMIDDWSGKNTTFKLTWTFKGGAALECKEDEEPPAEPDEEIDESLIQDDTEDVEQLIDPDLLAAGGTPPTEDNSEVDSPEMAKFEAKLSADQAFVTISFPGTFEWEIENKDNKSVRTGYALDAEDVDITDLPPGKYKVSLIYKQSKQYTSFIKK